MIQERSDASFRFWWGFMLAFSLCLMGFELLTEPSRWRTPLAVLSFLLSVLVGIFYRVFGPDEE